MSIPSSTVEIAFTTTPNDPAPVWVDVSDYVEAQTIIDISRGRADEQDGVQPSKLTVVLDNRDGRFTPEYTSGAYYPNVKKGRRIRVRAVHNAVTYDRFSGYIDEWPVAWPDGTSYASTVTVSASSRQARVGRGVELRSIIEEEILVDGPEALYAMGEPTGSIAAGNGSELPQPPMTFAGSGANPVFGNATGPGTDGLTSVSFSGGKNLDVIFPTPVVSSTDTTVAFEFFFFTTTVAFQNLARLYSATGDTTGVAINSLGNLEVTAGNNAGPIYYDLISATNVANGVTHHVLIRETISAGVLTAKVYLDGAEILTATYSPLPAFSNRDHMTAGGVGFGTSMTGVIAHMAVTSGTVEMTPARILAHANAGLTGFVGERSDQRIARLAAYADVPASEIATEVGLSTSIAAQETTGQTVLALMNNVVETESGVLFDGRGGDLTFHSRAHRYNAALAATFSAATGEIGKEIRPKLDDQGLVNDMTAARAGGVTARATDVASITEYGIYRQSKDLVTTSDAEVADAANWAVFVGSNPTVRVPNAPIDVVNLSTAQAALALGLEIGDRVSISGLPTQAPASSMDFFVEGYTEKIGSDSYDLVFNLSPAARASVWVLDSSTYSVLGSTTRLGY